MSPLGAKLLVLAVAAVVYYLCRLLFRGVLHNEAGASMMLYVVVAPIVGAAGIVLLLYVFKAVYYSFL
ncbi:MAG: hypothetical protein K0Q59_5534 [Paenibacillus sp.]|jgi:hypothetical protein|nr:hypothetical protein [Paenibacillus sp.]